MAYSSAAAPPAAIAPRAISATPNADLISAAEMGDHEALVKALEDGANVETTDKETNTPLHWAAKCGRHEDALALLGAGANVDARNKAGVTPLIYAAFEGWDDVVPLLLSHGADRAVKTAKGGTALDAALKGMCKVDAEERPRFAQVVRILSAAAPASASPLPRVEDIDAGAAGAHSEKAPTTTDVRGLASRLAAAIECVRQIGEDMRNVDAGEIQPSVFQALTLAEELISSGNAYLPQLAGSCERSRRLAGDEHAKALSVRDSLRRRGEALCREPVQEGMLRELLLRDETTCSLLTQVSRLAYEQLSMCKRFEAEMQSLNVTTSLEENWRDMADQRDAARSRYIKLQELYMHGLRSWQHQLSVAILQADARLRGFRASASKQRAHPHGLHECVGVDASGDPDVLLDILRSVTRTCNEAYAARQAESGSVGEEERIAHLRDLLRACTEEFQLPDVI
jgi:hypothetical protein